MSGILLQSPILLALALPSPVICAYSAFALVLVIGFATILFRAEWPQVRGFDKLVLLGPLFYAAPLTAFGTEHFTLTKAIASLIPRWIPWHMFFAYFVGACFVVAGLSLVTKIQTPLAASLLALTFFLFVALMDVPGWIRRPQNPFALVLALRELSFGAGALALAASLSGPWRARGARLGATIARCFIATAVLVYSIEQFLRPDHVPGVPLERLMPTWIYGHAIWTYLAAVAYAIAGLLLLVGKKSRGAATSIGFTVLLLVLIVYVPIAVVEGASLDAFNYLADTLMFGGAVLLLARAIPKASE